MMAIKLIYQKLAAHFLWATCNIIFLCVITGFSLNAQVANNATYKPLQIGDTVPDLIFMNMFNHEHNTAKLSDFEGKSVILDFWATWCGPCLASFPKLIEWQEEYKRMLKIIPVSNDLESNLQRFYQNNPFPFPTAHIKKNDIINSLFPHSEIPHYIWIKSDRTIYAITDGSQITEKNVQNFLNGKFGVPLEQKNDASSLTLKAGHILDSIEIFGPVKRRSLDSKILYQSVISRYDDRITKHGSFTRQGYKDRFLNFENYSPAQLFLVAYYGFTHGGGNWDKIYLDINNTTLMYPQHCNKEQYHEWEQRNTYSYRLILPPDKANKSLLYKKMQNDLKDFFGIEASFDHREVECLVLQIADPKKANRLITKGDSSSVYHSIFKISVKNEPIRRLIDILEGYKTYRSKDYKRPELELIDETGISTNIDLELNFSNLNDFQELQEGLKSIGLEIAVVKRTRKMLVLSKT